MMYMMYNDVYMIIWLDSYNDVYMLIIQNGGLTLGKEKNQPGPPVG